jgi:hypothetical protein
MMQVKQDDIETYALKPDEWETVLQKFKKAEESTIFGEKEWQVKPKSPELEAAIKEGVLCEDGRLEIKVRAALSFGIEVFHGQPIPMGGLFTKDGERYITTNWIDMGKDE